MIEQAPPVPAAPRAAGRPRRLRRASAVAAVVASAAALVAACIPQPEPVDANFQVKTVISGLDAPTAVRFADDGRIFMSEREGRLVAFDSLEDRTPTVVLDLTDEVTTMWDRGFMGIELDPDFTNGRPYLYALYSYDAPLGGTAPTYLDDCAFQGFGNNGVCGITSGRLLKIEVGPDNKALSQTLLIWDWCQQFGGHSVDDLEFGPDGALYASAGDGAYLYSPDWGQFLGNPCGDPPFEGGMLRAQDVRTTDDPAGLNGTVIRIDPDTGDAWPTNPWADDPDANRARVVAHGFRNPFRMTADAESGQLYVADVGWNLWEEVNSFDMASDDVPNFGWPCFEGDERQPIFDAEALPLCESLAEQRAPAYSYYHRDSLGPQCSVGGTSVTGLATVSGNSYPEPFDDGLYMADYSRECIWFVPRTDDGDFDFEDRRSFVTSSRAVDLQVGPGGDLYFVDILAGDLVRIVSTGTNHAPVAEISADPDSGDAPLLVTLSAAGSSDPDADALTMAWDLDDDGQFDDATGPATTVTFEEDGTHRVRVRVADTGGASDVAETTIRVGNEAPTATIELPLEGEYSPGETVQFSGSGSDPEDGALPAGSLHWVFTIQHCDAPGSCHAHPIGEIPGVASGTFEMPDHPRPSFVDIRLTATDSAGATDEAFLQIEIGD